MDRANLVTTHSSLGHCTGNLQALRHECQGLVNWYQSLPSGWVVRMKHINVLYFSDNWDVHINLNINNRDHLVEDGAVR